jgi:hypothetical protein
VVQIVGAVAVAHLLNDLIQAVLARRSIRC